MGRRALDKERNIDPKRQNEWVAKLSPHFRDRGLKNFSMDDMAEVVGVSKATLYKYFSSRDEIVALFIAKKIESSTGFVALLNDEKVDYVKRYRNAIAYFSETIADTSVLLLADLKDMYPAIYSLIEQFKDYSIEILSGYYKEGIDKGYFSPIHIAVLTAADQQTLNVLSDPAFLQKNNLTLAQAIEAYFEMRLNGVLKR